MAWPAVEGLGSWSGREEVGSGSVTAASQQDMWQLQAQASMSCPCDLGLATQLSRAGGGFPAPSLGCQLVSVLSAGPQG